MLHKKSNNKDIYKPKEIRESEKNIFKQEIIEEYKDIVPDIKEFSEFKLKGHVDFKFIRKDIRDNLISQRIRRLFFSIVDIRNNNSPTSIESNVIIKTDNKFSNETKKNVRTLISKGLTNNDIGYEMIYLYGYSSLSSSIYQENVQIKDTFKNYLCWTSEASFVLLALRFCFKKALYFLKRIK